MSGRHASLEQTSRRRDAWIAAGALILAVAVLAAFGLSSILRSGGSGGCEESRVLIVAAAPEIAPVVKDALKRATATTTCTSFTVKPAAAPAVASEIARGFGPDVWIPESTDWVTQVNRAATASPTTGSGSATTNGAGGTWQVGPSIATTPVVLAVSPAQADDLNKSSWTDVVTKSGDLRMANPESDTASRLAFFAARTTQASQITQEAGARLILMSRFAADNVRSLVAEYDEKKGDVAPFPATEQVVAAYARAHAEVGMAGVIPGDGTVSFDFPWVPSPRLSPEDLRLAELGRAELGSDTTRAALTRAGFRDADRQNGPTIAGKAAEDYREVELVGTDDRLEALGQWSSVRTDSRMLAVLDVSGSMKYPSGVAGLTRAQMTRDAAIKALQVLPAGSKVGGWIFSTAKGGPKQDWSELAPVERLDAERSDGKTHREYLVERTSRYEEYVGGDTGLYDTIAAAFTKMRDEYDPNYSNTVVIMTDGTENDDTTGGLSLQQLLDKLKREHDAERPIRLVTIGMGEADMGVLSKISAATGGSAFVANTPADIERVFVVSFLTRKANY